MRVYNLLETRWGLEAISRRRLKISRFADLNDPFELLAANLKDKRRRTAFREWKREVSGTHGLMCFSKSWKNPLLWSHYAEKHHGLALGFDVPDEKVLTVRYADSRMEIEEEAMDEETIQDFLTTKFVDWAYEQEIRLVTDLSEVDPVDGHFYMPMDGELQLKEVIVGPLSEVTRDRLTKVIRIGRFAVSDIQLAKARLAFKSYNMVTDKRGLR